MPRRIPFGGRTPLSGQLHPVHPKFFRGKSGQKLRPGSKKYKAREDWEKSRKPQKIKGKPRGAFQHLNAQLDDVIEFLGPQPLVIQQPQQEKKKSLVGTVAKTAALGGALYGGSLLFRGNKLKGGMMNPGKMKRGRGQVAPQQGPMPQQGTVQGTTARASTKAKDLKGSFKNTGGFSGQASRAGAVFKKDKKMISGFMGGLGKRLLGR